MAHSAMQRFYARISNLPRRTPEHSQTLARYDPGPKPNQLARFTVVCVCREASRSHNPSRTPNLPGPRETRMYPYRRVNNANTSALQPSDHFCLKLSVILRLRGTPVPLDYLFLVLFLFSDSKRKPCSDYSTAAAKS